MSDEIYERFMAWEQLYWLDKKKYPRNDQCYEAGYQAATCDAKALVGELVEALEDISGTHGDIWQELGCDENEAVRMAAALMRANAKDALTKATAWLTDSPVKEG